MPLIIKTVPISGSPRTDYLTDIAPGRNRPINYVLAGTPLALALPWVITGAGAAAMYAWGKWSGAHDAMGNGKSSVLDATLQGERAKAAKTQAETDAIVQAMSDPKGLSRETTDLIAKRRLALEERAADRTEDLLAEEATFRDKIREGTAELGAERARQVKLENNIREVALREMYRQEEIAPYRQQLEENKLLLQNVQVGQALGRAFEIGAGGTAAALTPEPVPNYPLYVPGGIQRIGAAGG